MQITRKKSEKLLSLLQDSLSQFRVKKELALIFEFMFIYYLRGIIVISQLFCCLTCSNLQSQTKGESDLKRWYDYQFEKWNSNNSIEYNNWIERVEARSNDIEAFKANSKQYMDWHQAKALCEKFKMRLPSVAEFESVFFSGVGESWNSGEYWTSNEKDKEYAITFDTTSRTKNQREKDERSRLRCLPNLTDTSLVDLEPKAIDNKNWSNDLGAVNWYIAQLKCVNQQMKLPTRTELFAAYQSGLTSLWFTNSKGRTSGEYWTSEEYSFGRAYIMHHDKFDHYSKWFSFKRPFSIDVIGGNNTKFHAHCINK